MSGVLGGFLVSQLLRSSLTTLSRLCIPLPHVTSLPQPFGPNLLDQLLRPRPDSFVLTFEGQDQWIDRSESDSLTNCDGLHLDFGCAEWLNIPLGRGHLASRERRQPYDIMQEPVKPPPTYNC